MEAFYFKTMKSGCVLFAHDLQAPHTTPSIVVRTDAATPSATTRPSCRPRMMSPDWNVTPRFTRKGPARS